LNSFKMQWNFLKLPSNSSNFFKFLEIWCKPSMNVLENLDLGVEIFDKIFDITDINWNREIIFFDVIWIRLKKVEISFEFLNNIMASLKIWLKLSNTNNIVKELHRFRKIKVESLKYCWNPLYYLDIWNNNLSNS
jgi:hypothetical protein